MTGSHPSNVFGGITGPVTFYGPTIEPSSTYNRVTTAPSASGTLAAGVRGTILDFASPSVAYGVVLPASPADGQIYTVAAAQAQTGSTVTTSPVAVPAIATAPAAGTVYKLMYLAGPAKWYIV